ncbi:MAG: hypothetical protein IT560_06455 [Alphaproteobacteria bacterium]|nr:hypothetical protein [Alphaproteobacteria bacterium]
MTFEKNKKLSTLSGDKTADKIFKTAGSGLMLGTGIVTAAGALAAATASAVTGLPMFNTGLGNAFNGVFAEKPLTEEQAAALVAQVMDDKLDPRIYDDEQRGAARGHIGDRIGDLSHLKQSFLHAAALRHKNADEVAARVDTIMNTPDFTQLMNEHSAVWREQQRVLHGQEVAAALTGAGRAQIKAPPRASFTRNRNTVTA